LITYSFEINDFLKNKQIKFDWDKIYSNPGGPSPDPSKLKNIHQLTSYKIGISTIARRIPLTNQIYGDPNRFDSINTYPVKTLSFKLTDGNSINFGVINVNNIHKDPNSNDFYFKKLEKDEFVNTYFNKDPNNLVGNIYKKFIELPPHVIQNESQKLVNVKNELASYFKNQHSIEMKDKINTARIVLENFNKPLLHFKIDNAQIDKSYLLTLKLALSEKSISLKMLFEQNPKLFNNVSKEAFENLYYFYCANEESFENPNLKPFIIEKLKEMKIEETLMSKVLNILDTFDKQ
jgi:hypothetical protein